MNDYKKLGISCVDSRNAIEGMLKLKGAANDCRTISDYRNRFRFYATKPNTFCHNRLVEIEP